jgi:hypothetical protein
MLAPGTSTKPLKSIQLCALLLAAGLLLGCSSGPTDPGQLTPDASTPDASTPDASTPAPPAAPARVLAAPGDGAVTLSWDAVCGAVDHYVISQGTDPAHLTQVGTSADATFTASGLTNGTTYAFSVSAVDASNREGAPSEVVSARPMSPQAYRMFGSDLSAYWENVYLYDGSDTVTDATIWVNQTPLTYADGWYAGQLPDVLDAGTPIHLTALVPDGTLLSATTLVPEAPVMVTPSDNSTFSAQGSVTVTWTASTEPERFQVSAIFDTGTVNVGTGVDSPDLPAGARAYTFPVGTFEDGEQGYIVVTAYNDGQFAGPVTPDSRMNVRAESNQAQFVITP